MIRKSKRPVKASTSNAATNGIYKDKPTRKVGWHRPALLAVMATAAVILLVTLVRSASSSSNELRGFVPQTPPRIFTRVPEESRKTFWAQNVWKMTPFERAFRSRGFHAVDRKHAQFVLDYDTKVKFMHTMEPWQRYSQIDGYGEWNNKEKFVKHFKKYEEKVGRQMFFNPETYRLNIDEEMEAFEERLANGGADTPWVLKKPNVNQGKGIFMLGPNSEELLGVPERVRREMEEEEERYIIQRYICNELTFEGRKFDLRMFWHVASIDPIVVMLHDGYVRIGNAVYDEGDFSNTRKHLTTHTFLGEELKAPFSDLGPVLKAHVKASPHLSHIRDPVQHIKNQIKESLVELVRAFEHVAFNPDLMSSDNGWSFYAGDYAIDKDLDVWFIEPQKGAGLHENYDFFVQMDDSMAKGIVDIQEEIWHKQEEGLPLFPLKNTGAWEIFYADDWGFKYEGYERSTDKAGCNILKTVDQ